MSHVLLFATEIPDIGEAEHFRSASLQLDVNLLRNGDRIVYLDAEVPHCALDLAMPEQQLDGSEIACAPVNEGCLCSSQRVRPV